MTSPLNILYKTVLEFETNGFINRLLTYLEKNGVGMGMSEQKNSIAE
jgi:hypothetical protein